MPDPFPPQHMLSIDECRRLLERPDLTDDEIAEFLGDLDVFLERILDDFFRDEYEPDEV
jgi:hypothetical protein